MSTTAAVLPFVRDLVLTVLIEGAVLWVALDPRHDHATKLLAALCLSSCTLPIVQFVFPLLQGAGWPRWAWLTGAEVFAPLAECVLFAAFVSAQSHGRVRASRRDMFAIALANVVSFSVGEALRASGVR